MDSVTKKKIYDRKWCHDHPEKMRANAKQYYLNNPEKKRRQNLVNRINHGFNVKESTLLKYDLVDFFNLKKKML